MEFTNVSYSHKMNVESEHCQELHFKIHRTNFARPPQPGGCGSCRSIYWRNYTTLTDVGLKRERVVSSQCNGRLSGDVRHLDRFRVPWLQLARYETGATSGICYGLSL
ncbi:Hypothetical_protein [Hexamita inflata]|uniref:Hypothetical_protein n=1 Tax=Hexamita inflata TaxID=28002 RepID=A0AA86TRA7_9EUKA|nr:Hypothetical protein HINF_LOCUS11432 [Hexamita inflata]